MAGSELNDPLKPNCKCRNLWSKS